MGTTYTSYKLPHPKTPNSNMLEVFDTARRAQHIALALSISGLAYSFTVWKKGSDMRWVLMQCRKPTALKEADAWKGWKVNERAGCADAMNSGSSDDLCLFFC